MAPKSAAELLRQVMQGSDEMAHAEEEVEGSKAPEDQPSIAYEQDFTDAPETSEQGNPNTNTNSPTEDTASQSSTQRALTALKDGFLHVPEKDRPLFFRLPNDLQYQIFESFLLAEGLIINPWMERNMDNDNEEYHQYGWSRGFVCSILCLSTTLHQAGMTLLYERNTFRFTRQVSAHPTYVTPTRRAQRFLSQDVTVFPPSGLSETFNRAQLMKKVILQDSDLDSDDRAKEGIGRLLAQEQTIVEDLPLEWTMTVMQRMAALKPRLAELTITIDEEQPHVLEVLKLRSGPGQSNFPTAPPDYGIHIAEVDPKERYQKLKERMEDMHYLTPSERHSRQIAWNDHDQGDHTHRLPAEDSHTKLPANFDGMIVELLTIRGMNSPDQDARRMRPRGSAILKAFRAWLTSNRIQVNTIACSGAFTQRLLATDGTVMLFPQSLQAVTAQHLASTADVDDADMQSDTLDDLAESVTDDREELVENPEDLDDGELSVNNQLATSPNFVHDTIPKKMVPGLFHGPVSNVQEPHRQSLANMMAAPTPANIQSKAREPPFVSTGNMYGLLGQDLPEHRPGALPNNRRDANRPYAATGNLYDILGGGFSEYASWEDFARAWKARFAGRPGGDQPPRW